MASRLELERDIDWLVRIIESNHGGLKSKTTNASDRAFLKMQIGVRGERLKIVRQQLAELPDKRMSASGLRTSREVTK